MKDGHQLSILLVCQNVSIEREIDRQFNGEAHYRLDRVASGEEAHELFREKGSYHLALYVTESADRGEELRALSFLESTSKRFPVVIVTQVDFEGQEERFVKAGAQDVLSEKQLGSGVLEKLIRNAIERHRLLEINAALQAKLESMDRQETIADLAGGLGHDIGNLLTPVVMAAELGLMSATDEQVVDLFKEVQQGSRGASELTRQLMDLKSIEAKRDAKVMGAREAINLAIGLIKRTIPAGTEFVYRTEPDALTGLEIVQGPMDLQSILRHLVDYSRRAIGEGQKGVIEIDAGVADDGERIEVSVSHNGSAFSSDPTMMEAIGQDKKVAGLEASLLLCIRILERLGGGIEFLNCENGKAQARFWIPVAGDLNQVEIDEERLRARSGLERIVFVDDNEIVASRAKRGLELLGYGVEVYADGQAALEAVDWDKEQIDAVVLDYAMPKLSGLEFARKLRASNRKVYIVFATAYAELLSNGSLETLGNACVVEKPYGLEKLVVAMQQVIREV